MPSPLGHALGGLAAGWLVAGRAAARQPPPAPRWPPAARRQMMLFALAGTAPDLDLLVGAHNAYTHSVGAAALTALAVLAWTRGRRLGLALGLGAAVLSHTVLDWLGSDTTPPIGIMALWPFSQSYYQSALFVFMAISRSYWQDGFLAHTARAVLREILILTPLVALIGWLRAVTPQGGSDRQLSS